MDELSAVYRAASVGAARRDVDLLIGDVMTILTETVPCELPIVLLHDDEDSLIMHTPTGGRGDPVPLSQPSVVRRIFQSGRGEIINDLSADVDGLPELDRRIRQMAAAPLVSGERSLGVVAACDSLRGAFTEGDLRLLGVLADKVALVFENLTLQQALRRERHESEALHLLSKLLTSSEAFAHVVGEAVRTASELLDCEKIALLTWDVEHDELVAHRPVVGLDDAQVEGLRISLKEPSMAGAVLRTNSPLTSNDAPNDAWVSRRIRKLLDARTLLAAPVTSGPRPIGVLMAVNAKKGNFDEEDLRFTSVLASRIAGVIDAGRARARERELMHMLREADRTKSDFVSILAHELRGPMTTVRGLSDTVRRQWDKIDDAKRKEFLGIMSKEVERLSRLVSDLLDLSRMDAGTLRYELEPMALPELVDNILTVHPSLKAQHIVVSEVPDDLPKVLGDRERIHQVLLNLISNANRYSPQGTTVTLTGEHVLDDPAGPVVKIGVTDEGIGIAPEDMDRLFTKFARLPKPSWTAKGTGLGLYITRGIVEGHGGRVWAESEPGKGSTFFFTLKTANGA